MTDRTRDDIVRQWLDRVQTLPDVEAIWLFGSMAAGTDGPGSDIDLRVALGNFTSTDNIDRGRWLNAFGPYLISEVRPAMFRLVVTPGYVVDLGFETPDLPWGDELEHRSETWPIKVLFARDGVQIVGAEEKAYNFKERHAAELPSAEQVETWIAETLVLMLAFPSMVRRGNRKAAWFYERIYTPQLLKLLYHLEGVEYGLGYKHIDQWMSDETLKLIPPQNSIWQFFESMLLALEELADRADAKFPKKFVARCWRQFAEDMDQPPL